MFNINSHNPHYRYLHKLNYFFNLILFYQCRRPLMTHQCRMTGDEVKRRVPYIFSRFNF